mgnify:CR=1 FL=1
MSIAWLSGLIILVILIIMLIAGAPIAISLAVSSICAILPVLSTEPALITGAQRIFSGISVFNLIAIPFFILANGHYTAVHGGPASGIPVIVRKSVQ